MTEVPEHFYTQSAVLPYRILDGRVEILLVSSRRKKRWVLPKGVVETGLSAVDSAVKEAWEEAGLEGLATSHTVGTYRYEKWGGVCTVQVFPLQVERLSESWPESTRDRRWFAPQEAARRVQEPDLKRLMIRFAESLLVAGPD